jgi:hypothetical protein
VTSNSIDFELISKISGLDTSLPEANKLGVA